MKEYTYLIVGGGMAADAAVKGIRGVDESGTVALLSAEADPPYKRPPLSKGLWTSGNTLDDISCETEKKGAEIILSRRAVSLALNRREVIDQEGDVYRYDRLLLATGGTPRRLPIGDDRVVYYRTCADYRRLRALSEEADHFAVIGGGFIGAEIAAALRMNGKQTTMVFPEKGVCGLMFPEAFSTRLNRYYEERGVAVSPGRKLSAIDAGKDALAVHLDDGHGFSADGIVAGVGIEPNTAVAEGAGLQVGSGVVVDEQLRTTDPQVFAAGDVAEFYNPVLDRQLRVEHEDNALTMGEIAGRNMAGEEQTYRHLPFFYSDLFDLGYEAVGETTSSLETVTDLNDPEEKGCIFYVENQRVRGVVFWNVFGKVEAGRELIASPGPHDADRLRAWEKEQLAG